MLETFRCSDPRDREIVMWDDRWYNKIIHPRHGRPQLASSLADIRLTLTNPDLINADKTREGVEVYYRGGATLPAPYGRSILKVCVFFSEDEWGDVLGSVLTVYPVHEPHPLEQRLWPPISDE
jgi:hypothetical protein